jgi:hypothetical protein
VGEMGDQFREDESAGVHPPLLRSPAAGPKALFRPFSVQIVPGRTSSYAAGNTGLISLDKVLYRTLVGDLLAALH